MQFLIIGKDADDENAVARRMAARDAHIAYSDEAVKRGEQIIGAATLNAQTGEMNGSVMIVEFENIDKVKEWLDEEAYITGDVWEKIEIIPCRIGPSFDHLITKKTKH